MTISLAYPSEAEGDGREFAPCDKIAVEGGRHYKNGAVCSQLTDFGYNYAFAIASIRETASHGKNV